VRRNERRRRAERDDAGREGEEVVASVMGLRDDEKLHGQGEERELEVQRS
jgi:hypothetical protein